MSWILSQADFPGVEQLRAQAKAVSVEGGPVTMLSLRVQDGATPSEFKTGPIPVAISVADASDSLIGELLLWVDDGYATALEFAWWNDEPPTELPGRERLHVTSR